MGARRVIPLSFPSFRALDGRKWEMDLFVENEGVKGSLGG
jgi:hypothetical protein